VAPQDLAGLALAPVAPQDLAGLALAPVAPQDLAGLALAPVAPQDLARLPLAPVAPQDLARLPLAPVAPQDLARLPLAPVAPQELRAIARLTSQVARRFSLTTALQAARHLRMELDNRVPFSTRMRLPSMGRAAPISTPPPVRVFPRTPQVGDLVPCRTLFL